MVTFRIIQIVASSDEKNAVVNPDGSLVGPSSKEIKCAQIEILALTAGEPFLAARCTHTDCDVRKQSKVRVTLLRTVVNSRSVITLISKLAGLGLEIGGASAADTSAYTRAGFTGSPSRWKPSGVLLMPYHSGENSVPIRSQIQKCIGWHTFRHTYSTLVVRQNSGRL